MRVDIDYGCEHLSVAIADRDLLPVHRKPALAPIADPVSAVRDALETPLGFPALRRALTPDDHVSVVLDERLPRVGALLVSVLEHIASAGVSAESITILCPVSSPIPEWRNLIPEPFRAVHVEVHDPSDRRQLSYLATTRHGRRIYLNRRAVDADQLVVLARRSYDPLLGYSGSVGAIYPALSDEATQREMVGLLSLMVPGDEPWPARREAAEVAWLLGAPFMIHVVEDQGDDLCQVTSGLADTDGDSIRALNARWHGTVDQLADNVIASITGDPQRQTFAELGAALACSERVVKPDGRILLLTDALPSLGTAAEIMRESSAADQVLKVLRKQPPPEMAGAFQWVSAAERAKIYLLSRLPAETAEELFTTPLERPNQVQRLLDQGGTCVFIPDAHKTMLEPLNSARE
ncbi:MAG TPA: lactate racemase domain-containing protein [Gemmataceae bacterium]|nr:lactate racemase domain-containing protein [Gemmataceae bacterium]